MPIEDYYSLLGVDRHAPEREIKRAYYSLARELHPDKAKSPEEARTNAERLAVISKAYNILKDPKKRGEYDASTGRKPAAATAEKAPAAQAPAAAAPAQAAASPAAPAGNGPTRTAPARKDPPTAAPASNRMSPSDIASQRVLTAQKAFIKGMEFYKNQDFKKALPFFEACVQNDPESEPHYHMKLAICLMRTRGSFSRAVEAAERACEMDGYNVEFKLGLGEIYETAGAPTKARAVYEDVLRWEPDNDRAKFRLRTMGSSGGGPKSNNILAKIFPSLFRKK